MRSSLLALVTACVAVTAAAPAAERRKPAITGPGWIHSYLREHRCDVWTAATS